MRLNRAMRDRDIPVFSARCNRKYFIEVHLILAASGRRYLILIVCDLTLQKLFQVECGKFHVPHVSIMLSGLESTCCRCTSLNSKSNLNQTAAFRNLACFKLIKDMALAFK